MFGVRGTALPGPMHPPKPPVSSGLGISKKMLITLRDFERLEFNTTKTYKIIEK
jgi:hypothetical protein